MRANGHGLIGNMVAAGLNAIGRGMLGLAKGAGNITLKSLDATGKGIVTAGKVTGKLGLKVADKGGKALVSGAKGVYQGLGSKNGLYNPIGAAVTLGDKAGMKMAKMVPTTKKYNPYTGEVDTKLGGLQFTKTGFAALVGVGAIGSAMEAADNSTARAMGTMVSKPVTATPDYAANTQQGYYQRGTYLNNGGADGSLVFAMHKNRHG